MPARNKDQEKEVMQVRGEIISHIVFLIFLSQWMEEVMGEPLPTGDFGEVLKDGVILCKLINKIQPGSVKKFKEKVKQNWKE